MFDIVCMIHCTKFPKVKLEDIASYQTLHCKVILYGSCLPSNVSKNKGTNWEQNHYSL